MRPGARESIGFGIVDFAGTKNSARLRNLPRSPAASGGVVAPHEPLQPANCEHGGAARSDAWRLPRVDEPRRVYHAGLGKRKGSEQQTPRRWGWGTPLKETICCSDLNPTLRKAYERFPARNYRRKSLKAVSEITTVDRPKKNGCSRSELQPCDSRFVKPDYCCPGVAGGRFAGGRFSGGRFAGGPPGGRNVFVF